MYNVFAVTICRDIYFHCDDVFVFCYYHYFFLLPVPSEKPDLWRQINAPDEEGNRMVQLLWKVHSLTLFNI